MFIDNDSYDRENGDSGLNNACFFLGGDVWHKDVRENLADEVS